MQIGAPDVAAIDDAERENSICGEGAEQLVELGASTHQIGMMAGDGKISRDGKVVAIFAEIARKHDLRRRRRKLAVGEAQRALL